MENKEKVVIKHELSGIINLIGAGLIRIGEELSNTRLNKKKKLVEHLLESKIDFKVIFEDKYNYTTVFIDTEDKKYGIDYVFINKVKLLDDGKMEAVLNDFTEIIATNFYELKNLEPICSMKKLCTKCTKNKMLKDFDNNRLVCDDCVKISNNKPQ